MECFYGIFFSDIMNQLDFVCSFYGYRKKHGQLWDIIGCYYRESRKFQQDSRRLQDVIVIYFWEYQDTIGSYECEIMGCSCAIVIHIYIQQDMSGNRVGKQLDIYTYIYIISYYGIDIGNKISFMGYECDISRNSRICLGCSYGNDRIFQDSNP